MDLIELRAAIAAALRPERFCATPAYRLRTEHTACETCAWEIYRGHLLDSARTRNRKSFETWSVFLESVTGSSLGPGNELTPNSAHNVEPVPILSIKLCAADQQLFVTRNLLIHGWEAFESRPGSIESRPVQKWMVELVATLRLDDREDRPALTNELMHCLLLAVVGVSRLPITSLESPLPCYALGACTYWTGDIELPLPACGKKWLDSDAAPHVVWTDAEFLEFVLRSSTLDEMPALARVLVAQWPDRAVADVHLPALLISVLGGVSLTPFTGFIDNLTGLLRALSSPVLLGAGPVLRIAAGMLRLLTRHLAAYDLLRFHSCGANYPDALALDAILRCLLEIAERDSRQLLPDPGDDVLRSRQKRECRRALRQAWILRKLCEGYRVPDRPTSIGENLRVLPEPFARVAEDQIIDPRQRHRILFEYEPAERLLGPAVQPLWRQCLAELDEPAELRELGTGLFVDRPLGIFKELGEVDRTPLVSYVAFSRSLAEARLADLGRWGCLSDESFLTRCRVLLRGLAMPGFSAARLPGQERPGVVALEDARRAADDFEFLYTTGPSRRAFADVAGVDPSTLEGREFADWMRRQSPALVIRTAGAEAAACGEPFLTVFDAEMRLCWRLRAPHQSAARPRYEESYGQEALVGGLVAERAAE